MSCLIMTPQIKEIAKSLNMNPEECKDWIGYWQEQTGANLENYPTAKELIGFINREMASIPSQKELDEDLANREYGIYEEEDWDWTYDDDRVTQALENARMTFQAAQDTEDEDLISEAAHRLSELTARLGIPASRQTVTDLDAWDIVDREDLLNKAQAGSVFDREIEFSGKPELSENVKIENLPYFTGEEKVTSLEKGGFLGRDIEYDKDENIIGWVNKNSVVKQFENPDKLINGIAMAIVQDSTTDEYGRIHFHEGGQKAILLYDFDTSRINYMFREEDTFGTQIPNSNYSIVEIRKIEDATSMTSSSPRITVGFHSGNLVSTTPESVRVFTMEQFYHFLNDDKLYPLRNVAEREFRQKEEVERQRQASLTRKKNLYDNINKTPEGKKLIEQVPNIKITANRPGEGTISRPYRAKMSFKFNNEKRPTVKGNTTLEAVQNGQRIATTRYKSDGYLDYWKQMKRGDVIQFTDDDGNSEFVVVINPLTQLTDTSHGAAQSWSNKEGWSMNRFNKKVKEKIQDPNDEAWQIEFLPLDLVMALQQAPPFESHFTTSKAGSYRERTIENVDWSDATVAFALDFNTAGEKLTSRTAREQKKYIAVPLDPFTKGKAAENAIAARDAFVQNIKEAIKRGDIKYDEKTGLKLNIAGNGKYTLQDRMPDERLVRVIKGCLQKLQEEGIKIAEVRSGGQSGADWAGVMAAQELGLPWSVHTTANYTWRDQNGKDISGKEEFIARFKSRTQSQPTTQYSQPSQTQSTKYNNTVTKVTKNGKRVQPTINIGAFDIVADQLPDALRQKADEVFRGNILKKRDRIQLISSLFSEKVSLLLDQEEENFNNAILNAQDQRTRDRLQAQHKNINRFYIIKKTKPSTIFEEIYEELKAYAERRDPDEEKVQNPVLVYSEDEDREEREARVQAFQEITDMGVFLVLAEAACRSLRISEQIAVDTRSMGASEVTNITEGYYKDNVDDEVEDDLVDDKHIRNGWGERVTNLSSKDSLSQKTRQAISLVPRTDAEGEIEYDDLGFMRYLDADEVHTTLNQILMNMTEPQDLIPMLQNYAANNPSISRLVEMLEEDEEDDGQLVAQFYTDFRKNFLNYSIQLWEQTDSGAIHYKTIDLNMSEGISNLINKWRSTYESGISLNKEFSIYDKQGSVTSEKSKENATKGKKVIDHILKKLQQVEFEKGGTDQIVPSIQKLLQEPDIQREITILCQMVGINTAPEILIQALSYSELVDSLDAKNNPIKLPTYPKVREFLNDIHIILTGVEKGKVTDVKDSNGVTTYGDLINTYRNAYIGMAKIVSKVYSKYNIESCVREKGNSYYSHITPNFLTDLIKELSNAKNLDGKIYVQNLEKKYGHCEWFKRNGEWVCDWLKELVNNPQAREQLQHTQELTFGGTEYSQLSDLQYTIGLMVKYWSNPNDDYAWYHIPIMSNSDTAEFIKFKRIHGTNWKDKLLTKLAGVVEQEYNRIKLVTQRNQVEGNREIGNFDKRGLEFCFFPALNSSEYSYPVLDSMGIQQVDINGHLETRSFFEQLDYLIRNDKTKVDDFIKGELEKVIDKDFEKSLKEWHRLGLFALTSSPKGKVETKFKYIPGSFTPGAAMVALEALTGTDKRKGAKELLEGLDLWTPQMEKAMEILNKLSVSPTYYNFTELNETLDDIKTTLQNAAGQLDISKADLDSTIAPLRITDVNREKLMEYFYNSMFATSQIIELTTTDLAFYKNLADFQKRFKEVHSPALRLNTLAKFHGKLIGREFEKTIYLKDEEIISTIVDAYKDLIEKQYQEGKISAYTYASMMAKYGASNHEVETKKLVESINPETGERKLVPQKIKYWKVTERDPKTGRSKDILVKTSKVNVTDAQAYRCLSSYRAISGMIGDWTDEKEDAYNQILDGSYRPGTLRASFNTIKGFTYALTDQIVGHDMQGNPIWEKIPTQHKNSEFLILTAYKAVAGELAKSADPNSKVARAVNKLKVINAFMESNGIDVVQFESAVKVGDQGVIDINKATSEDEIEEILIKATKVGEGGDPTVIHTVPYANYGIQQATSDHFFDTSQVVGTQIRRLITSDIDPNAVFDINGKKLTKKQWLKEYNALINQNVRENFEQIKEELSHNENVAKILQEQLKTNQRYTQEMLKAVTLDENGEFVIPLFEPSQARRTQELLTSIFRNHVSKQKMRGGSLIQATSYGLSSDLQIKFKNDDPAQGIEYMECYMPATSKAFFQIYMKKDGTIDIDQIPENLRRVIGYRIPTEDKYSMAPLRIKGFLPQENGGAIMLPAEITTIAGSDFDVDKLYIMLQDFEIYKDSKENTQIRRIEYNPNVKNTREARNNRIFDLMWAQLTHPDTVTKLLNPGGFDQQKIASRICTLLSINDAHSLRELLADNIEGFDLNTVKDENALIQYLLNLDIPTLDTLISSSEEDMNPLSPRTQVILQQQNMNAANLVGIYANHNASHATMQQTSLELSTSGSFMFNGKTLTSLHSIKNAEGDYISRNTAGYLALSVDDTKERLLYGINQNTFTADVTMLLSRLGYSPTEIGILLNSPIIREITTSYFNNKGIKTKTEIIDDILKKYQRLAGEEGKTIKYKSNYINYSFPITALAHDILISKLESKPKTYYQSQLAVGHLFKHMMRSAGALTDLVNIMKMDSSKNGAGPTVADMEDKIQKIALFSTKMRKQGSNFPLTGADIIKLGLSDEQVEESLIPGIQTFFTYGIERPLEVLSKFFPYASSDINDVCNALGTRTSRGQLTPETRNSIYNEFIAYVLSDLPAFKGENILETRRQFIHHFPDYFYSVVKDPKNAKDLEGNTLINELSSRSAKKGTRLQVITLQQAGALTSTIRDNYIQDWEALLYSDNPDLRKLGINLGRYCFFRSGMSFGSTSFSHLMPVVVRKAIPGYVDTLKYMLDPQRSSYDTTSFITQYVRHHLDNKQLVSSIPADESIQFVKNGAIAEEVSIKVDPRVPAVYNKICVDPEDESPEKEVVMYISTQLGGQPVYYMLDIEGDTPPVELIDGLTVARYKRIEPLGKNMFLEYEYGKLAWEVESAIPYLLVEDSEENKDIVNPEPQEFMANPDDERIDDDYTIPNTPQAEDEVMQEAFERIFDQTLNYVESIPQDVAFRPDDAGNSSYTDAEDNIIC